MTIFNLYIFDRHCNCIFFRAWNRKNLASPDHGEFLDPDGNKTLAENNSVGGIYGGDMPMEEEAKLVYGVVFSLRNMVSKLSGKDDGFVSYRTNAYKLHFFETPSGLKFVMNTDPNMDSLKEALRLIYVQIYVEFVAKNYLAKFDTPIDNELFKERLDVYVKSLTGF